MIAASDIFVSNGACRCGAFKMSLVLPQPAGVIRPCACQCAFCIEQGAATVSDPEGHLSIAAADPGLAVYRPWGDGVVTLHCARCGAYIAVLLRRGDGYAGALNIGDLDLPEFRNVRPIKVHDQDEPRAIKRHRRLTQYMPVELDNLEPPRL